VGWKTYSKGIFGFHLLNSDLTGKFNPNAPKGIYSIFHISLPHLLNSDSVLLCVKRLRHFGTEFFTSRKCTTP